MDERTEARVLALAAMALGLFGVFAPYKWHDMPDWITNSALAAALCLGLMAVLLSIPTPSKGAKKLISAFLIAGGITALIAGCVLYLDESEPKTDSGKLTLSQLPQQPSLVTVFMTDFYMQFTGMTTNWQRDLTFPPSDDKTPIYLNLYYDYNSHTKFFAVFVPNSPRLRDISNYIADNAPNFFDEDAKQANFGLRGQGETSIDRIADFQFSRRIYLYCPGAFSIEEIADVSKIFKDKAYFLQIRGDDWASGAWQNFKSGAAPPPPALFEIKNGSIIQIAPLKSLPGLPRQAPAQQDKPETK